MEKRPLINSSLNSTRGKFISLKDKIKNKKRFSDASMDKEV